MQLGDILDDLSLDVATSALEVSSVEIDSRLVELDALFFAMPGARTHGADHVNEAIARGAVCVVSDRAMHCAVPVLEVPSTQLRALLAHASAAVVRHPETRAKLVGVTGTNGKTSVTSIVASLARVLHWNAAALGTLTGQRTTPSAPELYRNLAATVADFDNENDHSLIALEVSSHALDQRRVAGLHFCVAAFTNLSHEHLDYHGTMEAYFGAKASLFTAEFANRAVVWIDDPYGKRLAATTTLPVTAVSRADASEVLSSLRGSTFFWRGHLVNSPLVGDYNVDNALVAMAIVSALGVEDADVAAAVADVESVPGRFEVLHGRDLTVVVDYAHTPEGLARLLEDVRALQVGGRLWCVFGAGGDRDRTKRPAMGAAVAARAERTIVTSDNPRSESPDAIIDDVMSGVVGSEVLREADRAKAIALAIASAAPGDVVVVAGKGHETTQIFAETSVAFDDRAVVRELLGGSRC